MVVVLMTKNKTMKKNLVIAIGVLFSTVVFAGGINDPVTGMIVVKKSGTATYKLFYKNVETSNVKVSIVDAKNKIVFAENIINEDGFVRPYNFSELADGDYTLLIEDELGIRKEKIIHHTGKVENLFNVLKFAGENKYLVTAPSNEKETVNVKIYNQEGQILYNESATLREAFARVYKLEKISGAVTFEISDSAGLSKVLTF